MRNLCVVLFVMLLWSCNDAGDCVPSCAQAECGEDGCGGDCGICTDDDACQAGQCTQCGNGRLDAAELCDASTPIACPSVSTCTSTDACVVATFTGHADTCDAECRLTRISECGGDDGCCPTGCSPANDADCALPTCGNGRLDDGELCDGDAAPCPDICEPTDSCERASLRGFAEACSLQCIRTPVTTCSTQADGCCPPGCFDINDADCAPAVCGDGVVTGAETCDDGIGWPSPGACSPDCDDHRACTIDERTSSEGCDVVCSAQSITACADGDGCCPSTCTTVNDADCASVDCGDGIVDGPEMCDIGLAGGEPGACPTSPADCDDGDRCTADTVRGDAASCEAECLNPPVPCVDGDGCCPTACSPAADTDCAALDLCEEYCFRALTYCAGAWELFDSLAACHAACQMMPVGRTGDAAGNSISCRIHHLLDANDDPEGHCTHSSVSPMGGCE